VGKKIMEINNNKFLPDLLNSYIKIYDNVLPSNVLKNFLKICEEYPGFEPSKIVVSEIKKEDEVNTNIRNVLAWNLKNINTESLTETHYCNIFIKFFRDNIEKYIENCGIQQKGFSLLNIDVLKYENKGHYVFHVDHGFKNPRTYSCIFFVNEDYEGGELEFRVPNHTQSTKIDKKKNRMIIWPSNFLYPHSVKPVTKGIRYSVVSWAL